MVSGNFNRHIESNHCSATFCILFFVFGRKKVVFFVSVLAQNDIVFFSHFLPREQLCEHGLGSRNSFCLSVCLSVTSVVCDKTTQCTADILIPHKRAITAILTLTAVGGRHPFYLKFELKVTHPLWKTLTSTDFHLVNESWSIKLSMPVIASSSFLIRIIIINMH